MGQSIVISKHGGIILRQERELLINPTSLIALTLRGYCQAIVRLLSLYSHAAKPHD